MACCLTAPSHHPKQCWLIISKVLLHLSWGEFHKGYFSHQLLKLAWRFPIKNPIQIYQGPLSQNSIGSGNGLSSKKQQDNTWTNLTKMFEALWRHPNTVNELVETSAQIKEIYYIKYIVRFLGEFGGRSVIKHPKMKQENETFIAGIFIRKQIKLLSFIISRHWDGAGIWNLLISKAETCSSYMKNRMAWPLIIQR